MAAPGGGRDSTSNDPTGNFGGPGPSQFGSSYYPIDTELTSMSASYNMPGYVRQMEEVAASVNKMDHGSMNNMPMDTNGAASASVVDPAMAPPQTPGQPAFMPSGRQSLDASAETSQDPQAGDKRKRSKASRACDECRRKKVKCDAPTEADGTPKTCANCQKAGVNCEFERKPMKRGPSKGYISALAERVQGLEQKQRQSFDGQGGFAESFSPDEQTGPGFNRASSFSGPTSGTINNPFPSSEYSRDRIPSVGWTGYSSDPLLRSRASGSLAIAPNETFSTSIVEDDASPKVQTREPSKSFSNDIFYSRPIKRQRVQGPDDEMHPPANIDEAFLAKYYSQYHTLYALLPDATKVLTVINLADTVTRNAFATAIDLLPDLRANPHANGIHDSIDPAISLPRKSLTSNQFPTYDALQSYLLAQGQGTSLHRSEEENLVLVWTLSLLVLSFENDMKHLHGGTLLPRSSLLHMARRVLEHVRTGNENDSTPFIGPRDTQYSNEITLSYNCICLVTKYHALAVGLHVPSIIPHSYTLGVRDVTAMPLESAYLAGSSNLLAFVSSAVLPSASAKPLRAFIGGNVGDFFDIHFATYEGRMRDNLLPKQVNCFLHLIMAAVPPVEPTGPDFLANTLAAPDNYKITVDTMSWADNLTRVLLQDAQANAAAPRYNPLDLYNWSLVITILCLCVTDLGDRRMVDAARERLEALRAELQKKSEAFHKGFGLEWFYGGKTEHWADVLLAMIEFAKSRPAAVDEEAPGTMGVLVVPKFSEFLEKGWMNAVVFFLKN